MQNNYLTDYIESKGYTVQECRRPAKKEVPANMRDRYSTYEEYEEALHDFLNGMWFMNPNFLNFSELMRVALSAIIILIGAKMLVAVLDSNMMKTIEERNARMERIINGM